LTLGGCIETEVFKLACSTFAAAYLQNAAVPKLLPFVFRQNFTKALLVEYMQALRHCRACLAYFAWYCNISFRTATAAGRICV
jgi:hypothetical protein